MRQKETLRPLIVCGVVALLLAVLPTSVTLADSTAPADRAPMREPATAPSPAGQVAATDVPQASKSNSSTSGDLTSLSLEDLMNIPVTSTVSRVQERADLAPGNVYTYNRDVIQNRGYRSLGELLQVVPGFNVGQRDLGQVVGVRGLLGNDNDKVSLLINGQNLNGAHEQDFLNGPINLDNVERVEVVVGPSSIFQPANTLAATINVITRQTEGVEVLGGMGNKLKYSETLMAGHQFSSDRSINFSFTSEEKQGSNGFGPLIGLTQPGRNEVNALDWPSYFGILSGRYGELTGQLVAYRSIWDESHIDGGSPLNNGHMSEGKYSLYLNAEHPFSSTFTGIAWGEVTQKSQTRLNDNGYPINAEQQTIKQLDVSGEVGLRYTGFARHLIQAGMQAEYDINYDTWFSYLAPGQPGFIPQTTFLDKNDYNIGFYADDEFQLDDHWKLVGGVRVDHSDKIPKDQWFPGGRAAVIDEVSKAWTTKLIFNRAVRMPSALEAHNDQWGTAHIGSPSDPPWAQFSPVASRPEILSTIEWDNQFVVHHVQLGFNIYHQELADFITWFQPHSNGGNLRGEGVELTLNAPLGPDLNFWANGAWNNSVLHVFNQALFGPNPTTGGPEGLHAYTNTQGRIIGSPEYTANMGLDYKIDRHLSLSPTLRYFTNQAAASDLTNDIIIRNRYYLDATLTWAHAFDRDLDFRLSVNNILNNRQSVATVLAGDTNRPAGTNFVLAFDYHF